MLIIEDISGFNKDRILQVHSILQVKIKKNVKLIYKY